METTTDVFLVALGCGDDFEEVRIEGKKHSERLIPSIDGLLGGRGAAPADITAIGVGTGPGSFTGIRIGASCAVTMAQVLGVPVYGIPYLDIAGRTQAHPVIAAYRDRFYHAHYGPGGRRLTDFGIIDSAEKERLGGTAAVIEGSLMLAEVEKLYKNSNKGDWKDIKPVYVMETVYKKKKIKI
ncbi:MAG: tRNA (adenosine(37)-N6)-threonylcarbamoyltransferase complex dimerization subunit type 1 TsaB [Elusimicrobia bacterium]|nr:tRNA (adenosine(37)-N6)-threonylcarbamoyltransferase complex dimerization subunit type 1 TsaB [Elusimicrobiota bacterium]